MGEGISFGVARALCESEPTNEGVRQAAERIASKLQDARLPRSEPASQRGKLLERVQMRLPGKRFPKVGVYSKFDLEDVLRSWMEAAVTDSDVAQIAATLKCSTLLPKTAAELATRFPWGFEAALWYGPEGSDDAAGRDSEWRTAFYNTLYARHERRGHIEQRAAAAAAKLTKAATPPAVVFATAKAVDASDPNAIKVAVAAALAEAGVVAVDKWRGARPTKGQRAARDAVVAWMADLACALNPADRPEPTRTVLRKWLGRQSAAKWRRVPGSALNELERLRSIAQSNNDADLVIGLYETELNLRADHGSREPVLNSLRALLDAARTRG